MHERMIRGGGDPGLAIAPEKQWPFSIYLRKLPNRICNVTMSSSATVVSFPVPSIAAGPQSIVTACEDVELSGAGGAAGSEPRFVEVR